MKPSKDSDQLAHSRKQLIRIITGRILDSHGYSFVMRTKKMLIRLYGCSGRMSLRLVHVTEGTFLTVRLICYGKKKKKKNVPKMTSDSECVLKLTH